MHLTMSRIIGFSMAVAMLGLVACAPKPNPEPFQEPTPAETVTETAAPAEGETNTSATASPAAEGESAQATASPAAEGESAQATASPAAEGEVANAENTTPTETVAVVESEQIDKQGTPVTVDLIIEADKLTVPKSTVALTGPVTFNVTNKTELPYKFHLEGIKGAVIEKIASGETGTLTHKVGPGDLAVTVTELRTVENPKVSPIKTEFLKFKANPAPKAEVIK